MRGRRASFPLSHELSETSRISGHILEVLGTFPEFWTNPEILEPVGTLPHPLGMVSHFLPVFSYESFPKGVEELKKIINFIKGFGQ